MVGKFDVPSVEQVIAVPQISFDRVPQRSAVRRPRKAEQLVEVPTEPGHSLAVLASKFCSRRKISGILSGQGATASGAELIGDTPVPLGRREVAEVFKVFSQNRFQQHRTWSRSLIFQLAVVFKVLSQARVPQLPHRVDCMKTQMKDFSHFSLIKKERGWGPHSGSELLPEASASTRGPRGGRVSDGVGV